MRADAVRTGYVRLGGARWTNDGKQGSMRTYKDIVEAFGQCHQTTLEMEEKAHLAGKMIVEKLMTRGDMPKTVLRLHPPDFGKLELEQTYTMEQAMVYNSEARLWELGIVLLVRISEQTMPREFVSFIIRIRLTETYFHASLPDTGVEAAFKPTASDETDLALGDFADRLLDLIYDYYSKWRYPWSDSRSAKAPIGFHMV